MQDTPVTDWSDGSAVPLMRSLCQVRCALGVPVCVGGWQMRFGLTCDVTKLRHAAKNSAILSDISSDATIGAHSEWQLVRISQKATALFLKKLYRYTLE